MLVECMKAASTQGWLVCIAAMLLWWRRLAGTLDLAAPLFCPPRAWCSRGWRFFLPAGWAPLEPEASLRDEAEDAGLRGGERDRRAQSQAMEMRPQSVVNFSMPAAVRGDQAPQTTIDNRLRSEAASSAFESGGPSARHGHRSAAGGRSEDRAGSVLAGRGSMSARPRWTNPSETRESAPRSCCAAAGPSARWSEGGDGGEAGDRSAEDRPPQSGQPEPVRRQSIVLRRRRPPPLPALLLSAMVVVSVFVWLSAFGLPFSRSSGMLSLAVCAPI